MDYFGLDYFFANWAHYQSIAVDKIWTGVVWATIVVSATASARWTTTYIRNRWLSNISKYEGNYFAYRWHPGEEASLVRPKVDIFRKWVFGAYHLRWTTPDGTSTVYPLVEHSGREIYAYGRSGDIGSRSFFVMHPAHTDPITLVSGIYTFMNMSHQLVTGKFLLSREELTDAQVYELMPPAALKSSQNEAFSRYLKHKGAVSQPQLTNVVPLPPQKEN
jgi:hypothetical protein